jgi:uncharacterized protein YecA (UPF0149 family)
MVVIHIRDCTAANCGTFAHFEGGVDGLVIDGLRVIDTPVAVSSTGPVRNAQIRRVFHHPEFRKIGRNDPCWCGSGKKFKKCCMP